MTGRGVIGVRAKDGRFMWNYNKVANSTANIPTPIADGITSSAPLATAPAQPCSNFPNSAPVPKWKRFTFSDPKPSRNHHGGLLLVDGYIYGAHKHNGGDPICVEMKTGEVMWGPRKGPGMVLPA